MVYKELTEEKANQLIQEGITENGGKDCMWIKVDSNECPAEMQSNSVFGVFEPIDGDSSNLGWNNWGYYSQEINGDIFVNFASRNVSNGVATGGYDKQLVENLEAVLFRVMTVSKIYGTGNVYVTGKLPKSEVIE